MKNNRGAAMLLALASLAIMGIALSATLTWFHATLKYTSTSDARLACSHIAEAGLDKALAEIQSGNRAYTGETNTPIGDGTFSVSVSPADRPGWLTVKSTGTLPRGAADVKVRLEEQIKTGSSGKALAIQWQEVRHE